MNMNVNPVNPSFGVRVSTKKLVENQLFNQCLNAKAENYLRKFNKNNGISTNSYFSALLMDQYPEIAKICSNAYKNLARISNNLCNFSKDYMSKVAKSIVKDNNLPKTLDIKLCNKEEPAVLMRIVYDEIAKMDGPIQSYMI